MHLILNILNILVYLLCELPRKEISKQHNSDYQEPAITSCMHSPYTSGATHGSQVALPDLCGIFSGILFYTDHKLKH